MSVVSKGKPVDSIDSLLLIRQAGLEPKKPAEPIAGAIDGNVTVRRSQRAHAPPRPISPLPDDSLVITPPRQGRKARKRSKHDPPPHRPAPQIQERGERPGRTSRDKHPHSDDSDRSVPDVTSDPGASGDDRGKLGGARTAKATDFRRSLLPLQACSFLILAALTSVKALRSIQSTEKVDWT